MLAGVRHSILTGNHCQVATAEVGPRLPVIWYLSPGAVDDPGHLPLRTSQEARIPKEVHHARIMHVHLFQSIGIGRYTVQYRHRQVENASVQARARSMPCWKRRTPSPRSVVAIVVEHRSDASHPSQQRNPLFSLDATHIVRVYRSRVQNSS